MSGGRIGVLLCDVTAGMNALVGIQQAPMPRKRTGRGSAVKLSLFGSAAEPMAVPCLQARYGGKAPERVGALDAQGAAIRAEFSAPAAAARAPAPPPAPAAPR